MKRERLGQLLFAAGTAFALALYALTACSGAPAGASTHEALAWSGVTGRPGLPHPVWGYFVRVFAGHYIALACVSAALSAGLLASVVNRSLGWRVAVGATLLWIFCPFVWNSAVSGDRRAFVLLVAMLGVWLANAAALGMLGWMRRFLESSGVGRKVMTSASGVTRRLASRNVLFSRIFIGTSCAFALVSLALHDYRLGEAATVYARDIVTEADGRWIVLNGVADDQIALLREGAGLVEPYNFTDGYRTQFTAKVAAAWPGREDLVAAAQISPATFVEQAAKESPESFYFMNGKSTTVEDWERRWKNLEPFLESDDAVLPALRRAFAFEGNALANALQEKGDADALKAAWRMYWRILGEIDGGNFSALVNLSEMVRRGYPAGEAEGERIKRGLDDFFRDGRRRENATVIARISGPVRCDAEQLAKVRTAAAKRLADRKAAGEAAPLPKEVLSLLEGNGEMLRAMEAGDIARAGGLARRILTRPEWRGFVPANAVMGTITASEGDYASSERFFRTALAGGGELAAVSYNDFADTLVRLGKLDEAETYARKSVAVGGEEFWLAKLTLAELLIERKKNADEARSLLREVLRRCPAATRTHVIGLQRKVGSR